MSVTVSVFAVLIAAGSFAFTIWRARQQTNDAKAATFLVLQRALIEPEMHKGREVLARSMLSADQFSQWRVSQNVRFREMWELAGRAMATLDVLALHAELGQIDEDIVIEEWGHVLKRLRPGFDAFRGSRDDGDKIWPHLDALVVKAEDRT